MTTTSPCLDLFGEHSRHRRLLAVEHTRRADVSAALVPGELDHAPVRRDVPAQDREASRRLQRIVQRPHHLLALGLLRAGRVLADRRARHRHRVGVQHPRVQQPLQHERHPARLIQVRRDVLPSRLQVAQQRSALGDRLELVDLQRHAHFPRDRQQVQHAVGRAAAGRDRRDRVVQRLLADHLARPPAGAQHVHHQFPALARHLKLAPVLSRHHRRARGRDPQRLERHRHRVRRELPAASARAGRGGLLQLVQLMLCDLARGDTGRRPRTPAGSSPRRPCSGRA